MTEQIHLTRDELMDQVRQSIDPLLAGVSHLLLALADMPGRVPDRVMDAADEIRRAVVALGGKDVGPPPGQRASVDELLGIDPEWTGGESVDEFVRRQRRER